MHSLSGFQAHRGIPWRERQIQFQGGNGKADTPPKSSGPARLPSDRFRWSLSQPKFEGHFNPKTAKFLLSIDYDGTLSTDLSGAERFQRQRDDGLLHLNTGRSIEDLEPLRERLQGLKLYALSTSNGEGLFINHSGLPAERWLDQISEKQRQKQSAQEPEWRRRVQEKAGWEHFKAAKVIRGFIERNWAYPGYGPLECVPRTRAVVPAILEALRQEGMQADFSVEEERLYKFGPQGFAKHSPVSFLAEQCPNLQRVVVAGDGLNDYALMKLESLLNGSGLPVKVQRVLMPENAGFVDQVMQEVPNPLQVTVVNSKQNEKLFQVIAAHVPAWGYSENAKPSDPELDAAVTPRESRLKRPVHPPWSPDEVAALSEKMKSLSGSL